jgi:hypothetical protein
MDLHFKSTQLEHLQIKEMNENEGTVIEFCKEVGEF